MTIPKTALAAVMTGEDKPFELRRYPVEATPAGMATLELIASGVCGTDVHFHHGRLHANTPCILGHEFIGRVLELGGDGGDISVGDRCIVDIAVPCGRCPLCLAGDDANCPHMGVTNGGDPDAAPHFFGGYGEINVSPIRALVKIPDSLDADMVSVFACAGPTALHAFSLAERAGIRPERVETAVVQGLGPVGSFAVMYLASHGVKNIIAVTSSPNAERMARAKELGAAEVFSLKRDGFEAVSARVSSLSGGYGADLVYEASGSPAAVPQGMELLRNRGAYLVPGQYSDSGTVSIAPQLITFKALQILGSSQYSLCDVERYLAFLEAHPELHAKIAALASRYPVADVNTAFADLDAGRCVKALLVK